MPARSGPGWRGDHPGQLLRAALGWALFKKFLLVHHQSEDDTLWPALRARVAGLPDRVALADALEAEHAAIEPLLTAIDAAAADPDYGYQRLGDIVDELTTKLTAHLAHEETDGLPLIDMAADPDAGRGALPRLGRGLRHGVRVQVAGRDRASLCRQLADELTAHAGAAAGHHCELARERIHRPTPPLLQPISRSAAAAEQE